MTTNQDVDVVVLGAGPGGYTAAFRAADLGLSVCLVDKRQHLGGVCLNVGCIPSKTLLHASELIEHAADASEFGISFSKPEIDISVLKAKKQQVINQLTSGLATLCSKRNITSVRGTGTFTDKTTLTVAGENEQHQIFFKHAIIATGSHPFKLPGIPEDPRIWNSTDALELRSVPERLLIIGGGIIGLEMAQVYAALGSDIIIVEMESQLIPPADKDVVQPLFLKLKKKYQIHLNSKVTAVAPSDEAVEVQVEGGKEPATLLVDAVLVAVGRRPNSSGVGLERIGVKVSEQGFIEVNERQQTSVDTIYAIGDVTGEPMLAHRATHQGKVAAEVIAGHASAFTPMTIPSVAYTNPEIAWMGVTEKEAKEKGISFEKGKFSWGASGRALSSGATTGASKVLFDSESGRIIGAAICGASAGELIHEAIVALEMGADAEDISKTIHAHPTLAETVAFAAEMVDGSITDALPPKKKK